MVNKKKEGFLSLVKIDTDFSSLLNWAFARMEKNKLRLKAEKTIDFIGKDFERKKPPVAFITGGLVLNLSLTFKMGIFLLRSCSRQSVF